MIDQRYELKPFGGEHAEAVAGWVVSPHELFMVAPLTRPPLTPEKVRAWTAGAERGYVYVTAEDEPIAYGELNPMPSLPGSLWVGHFVVAPWVRGCSVGGSFLHELLEEAFARRCADSVGLVVFPENQAAIRCYGRAGFVDLGPQRRRFPGSLRKHELRYMQITQARFRASDKPDLRIAQALPPSRYAVASAENVWTSL